jgi:hypothetical protein
MELENLTRYPAGLFRSVIDDNRFAAAVVARVTFDLHPDGPRLADEQPWIVSAAPWKNEHGQMDGDEVFYRGGVDVFVFGKAWAPGRSVTESSVVVEVGKFRHQALVIGDRAWVRRMRGDLVSTSPKPFESVPLTLAHAFGGKDQWDGLDIPYPDNPEGRGYATEEKNAEGKLLPNIEDPSSRIVRWDDRPDPVGFGMCPMTCGLRLRNGIVLDEKKQIQDLKPTLFNSAFPAMIAQRVVPGDLVRVSGVLRTGKPLVFQIPSFDPMVRLRFGNEVIERPLDIDQVGIESEHNRFFITYRYPFRYVMYPLQKRTCELLMTPSAALSREARKG